MKMHPHKINTPHVNRVDNSATSNFTKMSSTTQMKIKQGIEHTLKLIRHQGKSD